MIVPYGISLHRDLEVGSFRRLRKLLVSWTRHKPSNLAQNRLHGEVSSPGADAWQRRQIDLAYAVSRSSYEHDRDDFTLPFLWSTHGRLTLLMNVTSGG